MNMLSFNFLEHQKIICEFLISVDMFPGLKSTPGSRVCFVGLVCKRRAVH